MLSPKSFDIIHDLFASNQRESVIHPDSDASKRFQGEVYEQLAELEYIYVDESVLSTANECPTTAISEQVSLGDFFEGLAQLATLGAVEVTDIVEAIHREIILRPIGRFNDFNLNKWQTGITGRIYGTVRYVMLLVGKNLASVFRLYKAIINKQTVQPVSGSLKQLVNVLNGVMGDHLVNKNNPIALPMVLYDRYGQPHNGEISGRVAVLCHGLCLSHLSWQSFNNEGLGEEILRSQPETTVLYLDYNTGQRISCNGRNLSQVLQTLTDNNPNVSQIDLVGHSMGGLVARSALFYGKQEGLDWIKRVGNLVTLGSPHHGAILERIGFFVQDVIARLPFANALAKLGDLRSAGIIDLRHGSIRDADWMSLEGRSVLPQDFRHPARLPRHVNTYLVAATLMEGHYDSKATSLLGDGLVTIDSALGDHKGEHMLMVPEGRKAVFYGLGHMSLIYSKRVHKQVVAWLLDNGKSSFNGEDDALGMRIHSYPDDFDVAI